MFEIRFFTTTLRPSRNVTIRTNIDNWQADIPGDYGADEWVFKLAMEEFGEGFEFKFILDEQYWMFGDNLVLDKIEDGTVYEFSLADIGFPPQSEVLRENGRVQQLFFEPNLDTDKTYDVIVIGSGIGGGILADQLSDFGLDVLVLEAGSYLFPTHVGNLPRQHILEARVDKHIWHLWDEFQITNYENTEGSIYQGGQGFNLGGRSIFWGAFMPRMTWWELDNWPSQVRWDLEDYAYSLAEQLLSKATMDSSYQNRVLSGLSNKLPDYILRTAPMAIQHSNPLQRNVPGGIFSTADLLMESRLTDGPSGSDNLTINLNHAAIEIQTEGDEAVAVVAYDMISEINRAYKGKYVVLSAGTVESAKLAQLSNLNNASQKIGVGISDHPIFFTHFTIDPSSDYFDVNAAAKVMLRHQAAGTEIQPGTPPFEDSHRYNVMLELGADFNQGRFIDPEIFNAQKAIRTSSMLGEIVFLFNSLLNDAHTLVQQGPSFAKPLITMQELPITENEWNEINATKQRIFDEIKAKPIPGGNLELNRGPVGGVAHEVGTLRMGTDEVQEYQDGVVDANLKFVGYSNLYVCDLSVFPSSPAANPTLTLAALALRLARHIRTAAQ